MYTFRKPKNAKHAIELIKLANVTTNWDISNQQLPEQSQKYFDMYQPIVFIYKNEELVASAHGKFGKPTVYDLKDHDVTKLYKKIITNISDELKQLELF